MRLRWKLIDYEDKNFVKFRKFWTEINLIFLAFDTMVFFIGLSMQLLSIYWNQTFKPKQPKKRRGGGGNLWFNKNSYWTRELFLRKHKWKQEQKVFYFNWIGTVRGTKNNTVWSPEKYQGEKYPDSFTSIIFLTLVILFFISCFYDNISESTAILFT